MRKLNVFLIMLCSLALAGPAFAESSTVGVFGSAGEVDISLPGRDGYRLCIKGLNVTADGATDDLTFYAETGDRARVHLTTDEEIGQTTMASDITAAASGVGTTAEVLIERANGQYAEWETLASFANLAPTVGATDLPFYVGDTIQEIGSFMVYNNLAAAAANLTSERGLFCGPIDSGLAVVGSAGVDFEFMYGKYYLDNEDRPVGWFEGAADNTVALPGKLGKRIVITEVAIDPNATTDDINWYTSKGTQAALSHFTADEAAAQTDLTVVTDPGFAASGYIIAQRGNGDYAELQAYSDYTTTALTVTAMQNAFKDGDLIFDAELYGPEWANMLDTDHIIENEFGLMVGPPGGPLGIVLDDSSSLIRYVSGYYEDVGSPRVTLAASAADNKASAQEIGSHLALPGFPGKRTCINAINYNPTTAATDELKFYTSVQPEDSAHLSADLAAAGTAITWTSDQGEDNFDDAAFVVIQTGTYAELQELSAASSTAATIAAVSAAYPKYSKVFEMETTTASQTITNPAADAQTTISDSDGLFCGPVGSPIGVELDGANSIIHWLSGYAE